MAADGQPPSGSTPRPADGDDAWRPDWDPQRMADPGPADAPGRSRRRGPSPVGIVSGVVVIALVVAAAVLLLGRDDTTSTGTGSSAGSTTTAPVPITSSPPDPAALAAARTAFEQVNAEAGSTPARQRRVLEQVVDPAQRAQQRGCVAAVTTVRLVPAWSHVRVAADGHLIVPSLVRIFTGTRITGTDVAIIDVTITAGQAGLPALCVS